MTRLPLEGIRVADFTWAWAGPYGTMQLALMGAEVIKIESTKRPDHSRMRSLASGPTATGPNQAPIFNELNLNKLSVTLDLTQPKAVELAKRVIAVSDVVADNFRPGTMDKLGLGYEVLRQVKPDIIMLSSSAVGAIGPERLYVGYAPTFSALGGIAHLTGYDDGPPIPLMGSSDLRSATATAFAILSALYHRAQTGEGQFIDLSSRETISVLIGDAILDYTMNHRVADRHGNRDQIMAPHNYYACRDKDTWIAIAVATDLEWQALCHAMGDPPWTADVKYADVYSRWQHQDEMDRLIEEWTSRHSHYQLAEMLQKVGVAATPALSGTEMFRDPHLLEREFAAEVEHPVMGKMVVIGPPWKFSGTPARVMRYGPLLGEHNDYVFGEILGMSREEIQEFVDEKVIN